MPIVGVDHIAIIGSNLERSKEFYTAALGCEVVYEEYRVERNSYKVDLAIPGSIAMIELFTFPDSPPRLSYPEALGMRHLAFVVEGVVALRERLLAIGVDCEDLRTDSHTGRVFFFANDPDGLPLEFLEG